MVNGSSLIARKKTETYLPTTTNALIRDLNTWHPRCKCNSGEIGTDYLSAKRREIFANDFYHYVSQCICTYIFRIWEIENLKIWEFVSAKSVKIRWIRRENGLRPTDGTDWHRLFCPRMGANFTLMNFISTYCKLSAHIFSELVSNVIRKRLNHR